MRPGIAAAIALALSTRCLRLSSRANPCTRTTPTPRTTPAPRTPARPAPAPPPREAAGAVSRRRDADLRRVVVAVPDRRHGDDPSGREKAVVRLDGLLLSSPMDARCRSSPGSILSTTRWSRCSTASPCCRYETSLYSEESGRKRQSNIRASIARRAGRTTRRRRNVGETGFRQFRPTSRTVWPRCTRFAVTPSRPASASRSRWPTMGSLYSVEFETRRSGTRERADRRCRRVESQADDSRRPASSRRQTNSSVWISTDARRLPVKLQSDLPVGSFVLALRDAKP